jgi:hypothetical protein
MIHKQQKENWTLLQASRDYRQMLELLIPSLMCFKLLNLTFGMSGYNLCFVFGMPGVSIPD